MKQNNEITEELDIFIELPADVMQEATGLNQEIAAVLSDIKNTDNIYHITLYQGKFRAQDVELLITALQQALISTHAVELQLETSLLKSSKHLWWNVIENEQLKKLHETVLEIAMTMRVGLRQTYEQRYQSFSKEQKECLDKYGALNINDSFKPHITVFYGSNDDERIPNVIENIKPKIRAFKAGTIAIGKIDMQGNVLFVLPTSKIILL